MKYLINGLFCEIIEAKTASEAWTEWVSKDKFKSFMSREEARQKLIEIGFTKIQKTYLENVFLIN